MGGSVPPNSAAGPLGRPSARYVTLEPLREAIKSHCAARDSHQRVLDVGVGGDESSAVQAKKRNEQDKRRTFVAIDEGMAANDSSRQNGSLRDEAGIDVRCPKRLERGSKRRRECVGITNPACTSGGFDDAIVDLRCDRDTKGRSHRAARRRSSSLCSSMIAAASRTTLDFAERLATRRPRAIAGRPARGAAVFFDALRVGARRITVFRRRRRPSDFGMYDAS